MAGSITSFIGNVILPKRRGNEKGIGLTGTYDANNPTQALTVPQYRDHLTDLFETRAVNDSRTLIRDLFITDSDLSATVNAYLTTANTEPLFVVRDIEGNIDREGHQLLEQILAALENRFDYSKGYAYKPSLATICENMRYMALLRGGIAAELVLDKTLVPREIRHIDMASIEWYEESPGQYRPIQKPEGSDEEIDLNIPTFFTAFYRRDPTRIYTYSPFVAAINTIAARQQVINDLYRIMQKTGYPRLQAKVLEEVLRKNAPAAAQQDEREMRLWINARLNEIGNDLTNLRPDAAYVHTDAIEPGILNEGGPAKSMDVSDVVSVLNAQNQAALKTVATVIGRGESGVNTASVEATIFAKNAGELNQPIAELLSHMLTLAIRLQGSQSAVKVGFKKVDLRPELELEPQMVMRQTRLTQLLSQGLISDDEFHVKMFNRIRPDDIEEKSGTGFLEPMQQVDVSKTSPNSDPQGRALSPPGSKSARSNSVQK